MDGQATSIVRVAAVLIGAEAVALLAFAVVDLLSISSGRLALGVASTVFFALYAVGLGLCARGLAGLHGWSRGPIVLTQIIQLGVAWSFAGKNTAWVSVGLAVPAVGVLAGVLAPSTTAALFGGESDDARH